MKKKTVRAKKRAVPDAGLRRRSSRWWRVRGLRRGPPPAAASALQRWRRGQRRELTSESDQCVWGGCVCVCLCVVRHPCVSVLCLPHSPFIWFSVLPFVSPFRTLLLLFSRGPVCARLERGRERRRRMRGAAGARRVAAIRRARPGQSGCEVLCLTISELQPGG